MFARHTRPARRSATVALAASSVVFAGLLVAPPAHAADNWSGIWDTHQRFSDPRLRLDLDPERGPDNLDGTYRNSDGSRGRLNGEVTKGGGEEVWTGTFHDNVGGGHGKFHVVLQSDKVSFKGWFRICDDGSCGQKYTWTGEHA